MFRTGKTHTSTLLGKLWAGTKLYECYLYIDKPYIILEPSMTDWHSKLFSQFKTENSKQKSFPQTISLIPPPLKYFCQIF